MLGTDEFTILQCNVNKGPGRLAALLRDPEILKYQVVAIQEPNRTQGSNWNVYRPPNKKWELIDIGRQGSRVCMYVNSVLDKTEWTYSTPHQDICTITLNVTTSTGNRRIKVTNFYNPGPVTPRSLNGPTTLLALERELQDNSEHVILGDLNLHHPRWGGPGVQRTEAFADKFIDIANQEGLEILNEPGRPTWRKLPLGLLKSVIDITACSSTLLDLNGGCIIREDLCQQSDHYPITTTFRFMAPTFEPPPRRNFKKMDIRAFQNKLKSLRPAQEDLPGLNTSEDIEDFTEMIFEHIKTAVEESTPWHKKPNKSSDFWTQECQQWEDKCRALQRMLKSRWTIERVVALRWALSKKSKCIDKAKNMAFRRMAATVANTTEGMWKFEKWAKNKSHLPRPPPQFPTLHLADGAKAETYKEKAEALRNVFFAEPPQANLSDIQDYNPENSPQRESLVWASDTSCSRMDVIVKSLKIRA
jgi:hypothetical protein